jgi:hypothetical protein
MFAAMVALTVSTTPAHAAPADFTGNWVMDESASTSLEPVFKLQGVAWAKRKLAEGLDQQQLITQSGDSVSIVFDNIVGRMEQKLVADGKPYETVNTANRPVTFTTTWLSDGGLQGKAVLMSEEGKPADLTVTRRLSADGKTMTIDVTLVAGAGEKASGKRVFRKQ